MEHQHYWAIAERDLDIQNPIDATRLRLLDEYCGLRDGLQVLDIGCGKAWLMRQWADKFAIEGTGVEINSAFLDVAVEHRPVRGKLSYYHGSIVSFTPPPATFDIVLCLGAAFTLGGFGKALEWMGNALRPGGLLVIGDLTTVDRPKINTGAVFPLEVPELISVMQRHDAECSAVISASDGDFESYISHHRHAVLRWARENPVHPERADVLAKLHDDWAFYLGTIRPHLGWSIFVGHKSA